MGQDAPDSFNAQYWRDRAAEARTIVSLVRDPVARDMMIDIANKYDHMAAYAAKRERVTRGCG